jgi:hypothetical protein
LLRDQKIRAKLIFPPGISITEPSTLEMTSLDVKLKRVEFASNPG